ncbi:MAG: DNA (cytosine-5-)-methyltransferase [Candidatus Raymondbacteria bacterium RifOxyA12_full_50_37]|uniref:Cytosine-specific methyltransferase n=1 Tax=Candidatus Raymondbacteria bacterium RIFOXYD12_FULL_49_13 TaxID=1817890 RepID=A0A1F7FK44_UNCRA|nr:MAG: DNA (cytosine-5-)-methyltransferase [Candidatus Raymondbacteria bacterium RifOxyA12_full_50_37]OGJ94525.1 MAG: DNA (cytosine-5-)-methyltransferase [Candidatus Raymondbacteria bacterium RIFOXYA2_FULL_49_16]OGJ98525.1 MAG: DNA (cytosine-5-)-methyltransferase [Candidatus Raymondbacteria bacterium RifOxyC12_full_50_8]OGK02856.1 MAG: DNA (cytosine-5-)-methyltransferase [Candidatus Raymondbacteria bacterium RifOxyB12_full_50_8]OGK07003.1 MAG: DNA (cytosine-5-)-methyltransferase [Candidatus Ra
MLTSIDLFAGAGGLSEGFRQAGFNILAANDFDKYSSQTFKTVHPNTRFLDGPIQELSASDFLRAASIHKGELDCLVGGPPCQAFSVYNHQRGMHDERSGLFREYLRIVEGLKPRAIVMENVTGITSVAEGQAVEEIKHGLLELDYDNIEYKVLFTEKYGVPQERRRIVFIATRGDLPIIWPDPTHDGINVKFVTIQEAIGDLPPLKNGEGTEVQAYSVPYGECADYQRSMRGKSQYVYNHVAPVLSKINLERMKFIPQGGSWRDIPQKLLPPGMKKAKRSDHTKRYGRMEPDGLASTILTKCDVHWGCYIHPYHDRTITVREAARIQSFPDKFIFQGPRTEQYRQVGNAVPPLLGKAIACSIIKTLQQEKVGSFVH